MSLEGFRIKLKKEVVRLQQSKLCRYFFFSQIWSFIPICFITICIGHVVIFNSFRFHLKFRPHILYSPLKKKCTILKAFWE